MKASGAWGACLFVLSSVALPAVAVAQTVPRSTPVRERSFRHPDLYVPEVTETLQQLPAPLADRLRPTLTAFGVASESIFFDSRTGRPTSLILRQPLIPGTGVGNRLSWPALAPRTEAELSAEVWSALRAYLDAHRKDLNIDLTELQEPPRIGVFDKGAVIFVHVPRVVNGVPVRDNSIGAAINHGNLILLGLQKWADVNVPATPSVSAEAAKAAVAAHVQPFAIHSVLREPQLTFVPMVNGSGIDYRLAWAVACKVENDMGTWEGLVDATNGTLFAFEDRNQYDTGQITGGVYPTSNDQRPPDGIEQVGWPMPFVDFTAGGVKQYTDTGGNMGCIPGSISTSLAGLYLRIVDTCGTVNETGTGAIDLGSGPTPSATDCTVPPGHSAGDTKSARSGFYELNRQAEKARGHLTGLGDPAAIWVRSQLTANMNLNDVCNAFWDGESVNFFRSALGQGCRNTGEIAAIFDHEWGHGLDNNGVNPNIANPGESIADIYAMLRLNESCMGRGFFTDSTCGGYGDECIGTPADGCTGVRDMDYANHRCDTPHTITWIQSGFSSAQCGGTGAAASCPGGGGPCGREVHCEGMVAGEAAWDLQSRDLRTAPFNYDSRTAHELTSRLYYIANQPITSLYTCSVGGGCSATGQYLSLLAADDDDGDITNGTPHMTAIRAAYERHEIHCATPAPLNSGCAGGPTATPTVTLTGRDRSILVNWTAVAGASSYLVYRSEGVNMCEIGKIIAGETSDLSFLDTGLANGRTYSYGVLPVGSNSSCFGRMSACVTGAPVAGANLAFTGGITLAGGDGDPFLDNCELDTITFSVDNTGVGDLTNVRITNVTPVTHPLSTIVTTLPATIAASLATCTVAQGSFQVIAQGLTYDGESDFLVEVTADELGTDTRTQLVKLFHTESDIEQVASRTFSFEVDNEGWTTTSGTFVRTTGAGAGGTNAHMSSSSGVANACDVVQSPLFYMTDTSTLMLWVRHDIEPASGGQQWDRANVSVVDGLTGERTVIVPSSGHPYSVPDGSANGTCGTSGQAGWNGMTPGFLFYDVSFDQAALNPGGAFTNRLALLEIRYGTDASDSRQGIDFDQVTLTNFYIQVPDSHSDDCALATQVTPAGLVVDGSGNGVLEVGEAAVVAPTWSNTGINPVDLTGDVTDFSGPAGPTYGVPDGTSGYGTLSAGASAACADCYSVNITAASRPATHWDASLTELAGNFAAAPSYSTQKVWTLHVGGSFTDVPSSSGFYPSIETVLHNGVTAGCGDGTTFCPGDTVTRQQMAVFLLKAKEGAGYVPPACTTEVFTDVPCASPFAPWVNELAARGVTAGCGDGSTYCPTDPTNRQQMAVFLLKTKEGSSYTPPACTTPVFGDVPCESPFAPWIDELVARGVTAGCGSGNYCPANQVARQQMAVFLVKTFGLLLYGL